MDPPEGSILVDDDDNEDLFVSAIDNQSRQTSGSTLKSSNNTMEDIMSSAAGDEIYLGDDDGDEEATAAKDTKLEDTEDNTSGPESLLIKGTPLDSNPIKEESSKGGPLSDMSSMKATLDASSTTTTNASEGLSSKTLGPVKVTADDDEKEEERDSFIEIKIADPQKVGEGMGSYVCYKVSTRTNLPFFRKNVFSVNRRFSDFLGLREKLAEKHIHSGHIVPPAPEKDAVNNAKVIMSKDESSGSSEFLEKRAASLERFLNRIAQHPILQIDPNFREFLELESDLPRAKSTSALSGAGVRRLFNRMGDTVTKITFRMDETDPWFEEKQHQIDILDQQLRKLHASVEGLIHFRKELTSSTGTFAKSAAMLGNCEEHTALSCALSQLAETHEKIEHLHTDQANNDFYHLSEPLRDYIALIGVVKELFHQRVKVYQTWQHAQQMLNKKRQAKAHHELAQKKQASSQDQDEIVEWEAKVSRGQEEFDQISKNIKKEVEKFELTRVRDFKRTFIKYMESLLNDQQQLIKYWEAFLPEAKAIS